MENMYLYELELAAMISTYRDDDPDYDLLNRTGVYNDSQEIYICYGDELNHADETLKFEDADIDEVFNTGTGGWWWYFFYDPGQGNFVSEIWQDSSGDPN